MAVRKEKVGKTTFVTGTGNYFRDAVHSLGRDLTKIIPGYSQYFDWVQSLDLFGNKKSKPTYTVGKKKKSGVAKDNLSKQFEGIVSASAPGSSSSSSRGGGVSAGPKVDLTPYINALKEGAAANKKTLSDSYAAERNSLALALKQQQENTATARKQAMAAFNSARADLEEDAYMNMRAAQQSAAARGIGGSGLQQLAQLSSQIASSKQTSDLSKTNTDTQNDLTKQLKDYQESVNKQTNDLITEERNKITEIDKNVAQAIAEKQYEEDVRYAEALRAASAANASMAASSRDSLNEVRAAYADMANTVAGTMQAAANSGIKAINKIISKKNTYKTGKAYQKALDKAFDKYDEKLNTYMGESGLGELGYSYYNYYLDQLKSAYNKAGTIKAPAK